MSRVSPSRSGKVITGMDIGSERIFLCGIVQISLRRREEQDVIVEIVLLSPDWSPSGVEVPVKAATNSPAHTSKLRVAWVFCRAVA